MIQVGDSFLGWSVWVCFFKSTKEGGTLKQTCPGVRISQRTSQGHLRLCPDLRLPAWAGALQSLVSKFSRCHGHQEGSLEDFFWIFQALVGGSACECNRIALRPMACPDLCAGPFRQVGSVVRSHYWLRSPGLGVRRSWWLMAGGGRLAEICECWGVKWEILWRSFELCLPSALFFLRLITGS